jgi:DNA topoisomerase-1
MADVRRLLTLPGYEVFKFVDESGEIVDIRRADINEYIKRNMGEAFSAKD